jgi:hypothetical protein
LLGDGDRGQQQQEGDGTNETSGFLLFSVVYVQPILGDNNYRPYSFGVFLVFYGVGTGLTLAVEGSELSLVVGS